MNLKRSRTQIACESCRKRKVKCDSIEPQCSNCERAHISCIYKEDGRRKQRKGTDDDTNETVSQRLKKLENMVETLISMQSNQSQSEDDESDEEDAVDGDLLHLKDRRSPVVVKLGDGEPLVTYSHGFTTSLLNATLMRNLCEKIGCDDLGKAAEEKLKLLWRCKMQFMLHERNTLFLNPVPLNIRLLEKCLELRKMNKSNVDRLVFDDRDLIQVQRMSQGPHDINFNSPYSLFYLILVVQFADPNSPYMSEFDKDFLIEQNQAAFKMCLHMFVPSSHSTFLLLRLHLYAIYVMYRKVIFAHLRSLVAVTLSMAYELGLHRNDGSRMLPADERRRRTLVWIMLKNLDVKLSCSVSCVPQTHNDDWPRKEIEEFDYDDQSQCDIAMLLLNAQLNIIYVDMFNDLFSQRAMRYPVKVLMDKLCKSVVRLDHWWTKLPNDVKIFMNRVEGEEDIVTAQYSSTPLKAPISSHNNQAFPFKVDWITTTNSIRKRMAVSALLSYYHILQLVHSIPAFSPSCLRVYRKVPKALQNSLDILNASSIRILKLSFHAEGHQSFLYLPLTATNAFSAMFLKQIRDLYHPTNSSDLRLIYQYIHRFREITKYDICSCLGTHHIDLVQNMWNIFANILTQMQHIKHTNERHLEQNFILSNGLTPEVGLWDTFNQFNGIELDLPPESSTDYTEEPFNNCVVL